MAHPVRRPSCIFDHFPRPSGGGVHTAPFLLLSKMPNQKTEGDPAAKYRAPQGLSTLST